MAAILAVVETTDGGGGVWRCVDTGLGLDDFDLDKLRLVFFTTLPAPGKSSKNESELGSSFAAVDNEDGNVEEFAGANEAPELTLADGVESQL